MQECPINKNLKLVASLSSLIGAKLLLNVKNVINLILVLLFIAIRFELNYKHRTYINISINIYMSTIRYEPNVSSRILKLNYRGKQLKFLRSHLLSKVCGGVLWSIEWLGILRLLVGVCNLCFANSGVLLTNYSTSRIARSTRQKRASECPRGVQNTKTKQKQKKTSDGRKYLY